MSKRAVFVCAAMALAFTNCFAVTLNTDDTSSFTHSVFLDEDENYQLFWRFNDTHITFKSLVKTRGYVGFGLSPNGGMKGADIVIGWVKDGEYYFKDRHGMGNQLPEVDKKQNWNLLNAQETSDYTSLIFERPLMSCDKAHDLDVLKETQRLIWAYNDQDPDSEDRISYHGAKRGVKSVYLLKLGPSKQDLLDDIKYIDVVNPPVTLTNAVTIYWRTAFRLPDFAEKHHIIGLEPLIKKENLGIVHHIVVHECTSEEINDTMHGRSWNLVEDLMPEMSSCGPIMFAWAIGGGPVYLPENVGFPLGGQHKIKFILMETHYDNPGRKPGIQDNSGIRLVYTKQLRQYDAGTLAVGLGVSPLQVIPPHADSFTSTGYCHSNCSRAGLMTVPDGIHAFSVFLHSHLLGRKLRLRHFRDGRELPPIASDENYDFNYQDIRILPNETTILPGDDLLVECEYSSTDRTNITFGGLGSNEEMCLAFIGYYPKVKLSSCSSVPTIRQALSFMPDISVNEDGEITAPAKYFNKSFVDVLTDTDWTIAANRRKLEVAVNTGNVITKCLDGTYVWEEHTRPKIKFPYVKPASTCYKEHEKTEMPGDKDVDDASFMHSIFLDENEKYQLFWRFNDTHITFKSRVKTRGYVGFGLSPNGAMKGADIVIGWVKDGKYYFQDRHGTGNQMPEVDKKQNWKLLNAEETSNYTSLVFIRPLKSCDKAYDLNILTETHRVIWAYNDRDPDNENSILYHSSNRGVKSVRLLAPLDSSAPDLPDDIQYINVLNPPVTLTNASTTYWRTAFRLPDLSEKHHIIGMEPIIQKENLGVVHHITLYECTSEEINETMHGRSWNLVEDNMPEMSSCALLMFAWGIGGGPYYLPENVAFPIGGPHKQKFVLMETHYDNPQGRTDIRDSSGMRLMYTKKLRDYDAGMLMVGADVSTSQVIPPHADNYRTIGYCPSKCTQTGLTVPEGINIFAVGLHSHLLGRKLRLRHFRDGTELPPISSDENFDFNYQDHVLLPQEITILPGDELLMECDYSSTDKSTITFGGLGTHEEMCLGFLSYYPKVSFAFCTTSPTPQQVLSFMPNITFNKDGLIATPANYVNKTMEDVLKGIDWTDGANRRKLEIATNTGNLQTQCYSADGTYVWEEIPHPQIKIPYVKPATPCYKEENNANMPGDKDIDDASFMHSLFLDENEKYQLFWRFNNTHITFKSRVKTRGYVGFGLSPNGGMKGADIVIGWVKDGKYYFKDRHGTGNQMPELDKKQNWKLLSAEETNEYTSLVFARPLISCDKAHDIDILKETQRVIWAYNDQDPDSENSILYHSSYRGVKSVRLLNVDISTPDLPDDIQYINVLNPPVTLTNASTTYWKTAFRLPDLSEKHHIIGMEPIIQKENLGVVHHMLLYECTSEEIDETMHGRSWNQMEEKMPEMNSCSLIMFAWAIGGGPISLPENVAFPIGGPHKQKFAVLETHYDNPQRRSDIKDSSGMRLIYTKKLRDYDIGMLMMGAEISTRQVIPPHADNYRTIGYCPSKCTQMGLMTVPQGINIFGLGLHSHLLGRKLRLRHFRNGTELPPISSDENYDFSYQHHVILPKEITVLPGDDLLMECDYSSTDRSTITFGGDSTQEEMCLGFLNYYPKVSFAVCTTSPTPQQILSFMPNITFNQDGLIATPAKYVNKTMEDVLKGIDWTDGANRRKLEIATNTGNLQTQCFSADGNYVWEEIPHPKVKVPYVKPPAPCFEEQDTSMPGDNDIDDSSFMHSLFLDENEKYQLFWRFNSTHITFKCRVKTRGYVGFGLSPNGGMKGADIVIGWVKDGKYYFKDRHGTGNQMPELDSEQNWKLLHANESNEYTSLVFVRPLRSCDRDNDLDFLEETQRVIWAYNDKDPTSENNIVYHAANRGVKSLYLLGESFPKPDMPEGNLLYMDVTNPAVNLTDAETIYWRIAYKLPELSEKHHIIGMEPLIQKENLGMVHHILIYMCTSQEIDENMHLKGWNYILEQNEAMRSCDSLIFGWGVGGGGYYLPEHVGTPFGGPHKEKFLMMETHYDNPQRIAGRVDSSGLRLIYTKQVRRYDAGTLAVGAAVTSNLVIPPYADNFRFTGYCHSVCTEQSLTPEGIHAFALIFHSHLLGRKLRLRHIRNGIELPPLASDEHYDFNYQEKRSLAQEITILPGDDLVVECDYSSVDRKNLTLGGLSSHEEMCLTFLNYYPKGPLVNCVTVPTTDQVLSFVNGVTIKKGVITEPAKYANKTMIEVLNTFDWKNETNRKKLEAAVNTGDVYTGCVGDDGSRVITKVPSPQIRVPYIEESKPCVPGQPTIEQTTIGMTPVPNMPYLAELIPNQYYVAWEYDDSSITFQVHARTKGWVGFGISRDGQMSKSDVVIGWVSNGNVYFSDRYAESRRMPKIDKLQNWRIVSGQEKDGFTILRFRRPLLTCDKEYDIEIKPGAMHIIWSFDDKDPLDAASIAMHSTRGHKMMELITPSKQYSKECSGITTSDEGDLQMILTPGSVIGGAEVTQVSRVLLLTSIVMLIR